MKIFINKDTNFDDVKTLALGRVDEEAVELICESGYKMTPEQLNGLSSLPDQIIEVTSLETDEPANFVDSMIDFKFRLHYDNWERAISTIGNYDYYQGFIIEVDLDTMREEDLVDKLIYFYETMDLYRDRDIFLNATTNKVDFSIYNTFSAFMAEEMGNLCFWKHINKNCFDEDKLPLFGLVNTEHWCNTHCLGIIKDKDYAVCEYNMNIVCELEVKKLPANRKSLMESYRKLDCVGCGKHA